MRIKNAVIAIGFLGAVTAVGVVSSPAGAHVSLSPAVVPPGGVATVAFQVPNESETASTVKLEVQFPTDTPIVSVSTEPVPGWTVEVKRTPLPAPVETEAGEVAEAVSTVTWSGGQIAPGQFQSFPVVMGPLPSAGTLVFKAVQTYSDGKVVRWIETAPEGAAPPNNPAPELKVDAAAGAGRVAPQPSVDRDSSARLLAIAALVLGGLALAVGVVALVRNGSGAKA